MHELEILQRLTALETKFDLVVALLVFTIAPVYYQVIVGLFKKKNKESGS